MLRHKTHERFSCFGINIFCQFEINPGINPQGMLQHGSFRLAKALKEKLGSTAREQALEGTESSLFSHILYFIWEIHQLTVTEHVNKDTMRSMKCCLCCPRTEFPALADGGVMKAAGTWSDQHNGSVLGTIKH